MSLSATPKTPIRTPQNGSSTKTLQLTPIWEEVVKNRRLPPEINENSIFQEISFRLEDPEWPVRQHAFRVLYDVIPVVPKDRLDERITQNDILIKLVMNLGHSAPGVRKVALETIGRYLKQTRHAERMLQNFVNYGIKEESLTDTQLTGVTRENVTLGSIISLVEILRPFIYPENGGYSVSQLFLNFVIGALCEKLKDPLYREKALEILLKIKEMIGDGYFYKALDQIPEELKESLKEPKDLNFEDSGIDLKLQRDWSDEKSDQDNRNQDSDQSFEIEYPNSITTYHNYQMIKRTETQYNNWSGYQKASDDDFSDCTDTDTYTKEPAADPNEIEVGDKTEEPSPRVVLETEIKISDEKAIKMTIVEDEKDSEVKDNEIDIYPNESENPERRYVTEDGDLIMKILHNNDQVEDNEERKRTPRRVRFGGEVIKLRTPDSDATDVTIEIKADQRPGTAHGKPEKTHQEITTKGKADRLVIPDIKGYQQSHIPILISPVVKTPEKSPSKKTTEGSKIPIIVKDTLTTPEIEEIGSLNSSSSSENDLKDKLAGVEDSSYFWKWAEMGLVEEQVLNDLKNKNNWKTQYQSLEQLKTILINPKTIEKLGKTQSNVKLNSLLKCLLFKLPQSNNQQTTTLSLSIVSQLLETLPVEKIKDNLDDIVRGLCKYVGGCKNVNLKIESVQSLKILFGILEPSSIIDVLLGDHCLSSHSSKLRENSFLAIMYALMTFPSNLFDVEKIAEKLSDSTADSRRRVRHASLEAIAILSQFCSSEILTKNIARVAESLPNQAAKTALISAVQARLSRRMLPTVSNEGLVLYALQIPASRRLGGVGNPIGADVDWILSGTGSVSTGSARSRCQLNAAQRLEISTPKSLSPTKWGNSEKATSPNRSNDSKNGNENPWTIQKNRTEHLGDKSVTSQKTWNGNRFYKATSIGNLTNGNMKLINNENSYGKIRNNKRKDKNVRINPEEVAWALVPVSTLEDSNVLRKNNALWGELGIDNNQYFSSSLGAIRPLYLKLQTSPDHLLLSRSSDDLQSSSRSYARHRVNEKLNDDFSQIRVLTPSILRDRKKNDDSNSEPSARTPKNERGHNENSRIPPLHSGDSRIAKRNQRQREDSAETKPLEIEKSSSAIQRSIINQSANILTTTTPPAAVFLPNIHDHSNFHQNNDRKFTSHQKPPLESRLSEIDEVKLQDTMTQLSGLLTTSKALSKSLPSTTTKNLIESETITPIRNGIKKSDEYLRNVVNGQPQKLLNHEYPKVASIASAPPVITTDNRELAPSTSSSNSTDLGGLNGNEIEIRRLDNGTGALKISNSISYRNLNNSINEKVKAKRAAMSKNKVGCKNPFSENMKPFDRPKESLETCFNQLESQQWEVTMVGLTSLVRLLRHHPAIVLNQLHPIIVALGRQIRNLRSQVSRAACQVSAEMFSTLKRNLEPDLEELAGPLFHRSADTNRFIRADCNHALDNMTDNISPGRLVTVIITKGASHQNATVRTVSARLLLRLTEKLGADKVLSLPKEIRDKMLQMGANLLMEGKLETRSFAKSLFRIWSSYPGFYGLILEVIPPNVMRHINKTLISLKS